MSDPVPPWRSEAGALVLSVRLTPMSGRDAIDGIAQLADGRRVLKVRVRAPAHEGEANAALITLIAKRLGIAPRDVELAAGLSARVKRVKITGSAAALTAALTKICARE